MGRPFKIAPSHGDLDPMYYMVRWGHTQVFNSNGISIGSAIFARLTSVTDATWLVTIGHIYVGRTAMRPYNNVI